jgi:pyruvate,water dikinase
MQYIKKLEDLSITDAPHVGGKNASLGEMIAQLSAKDIRIPKGFALTADAYWHVINSNDLLPKMRTIMEKFNDPQNVALLEQVGQEIRDLIEHAEIPKDLVEEIDAAYRELSQDYGEDACDVAVRSSATAEDSPTASFAGQQESYLNIKGKDEVVRACQTCMASLFTNRAIVYRINKGFDHFKMALSVCVQKMIRSDLAVSGVAFSLDTETGFRNVVMIDSSYGLGESIVQGKVIPDEFFVGKPTLLEGFKPIIKKQLGSKETKRIYSEDKANPVVEVAVPLEEQQQFTLSDNEILELARDVVLIEEHYSQKNGSWVPMDIEWAKDGRDEKLYIIQARPETVHAHGEHLTIMRQYALENGQEKEVLTTGQSIGQQIVAGTARVAETLDQVSNLKEGDILVTTMTNPDWVPIMKRVAGIITANGGRTCHAAIVGRELGLAAIVGAEDALERIQDGQEVTMDCSQGETGLVYKGKLPFSVQEIEIKKLPTPPVDLYLNIGTPGRAFSLSFLPVSGVGLARIEFIIATKIGIHPMALLQPDKIDPKVAQEIKEATSAYDSPVSFFVDMLAQEVGTIADAFYPKPVLVRFSDFKTNEYRSLLGGEAFEPIESNPMLGFRGASRYYDERYKEAFALECAAMKKAREEMGFTNVQLMVPFVRTTEEAKKVLEEMKKNGLVSGQNGLKIVMMVEIPANVLLIEDFCPLFDGFSIGSNDLTQMVLSVDRDSSLVAPLFDEQSPAVKIMLKEAIEGAHKHKKPIGICGQAPADYPELANFLVDTGIDYISVDAASVVNFLMREDSTQ